KLISYPRTDCRHLSSAVAGTLPQVVAAIAPPYAGLLAAGSGERPLSRRFVDDAKVTEHHAILPTSVSAQGRPLSREERLIYDLVCRRLLQAWHGDYVWADTTVLTEVRPPARVAPVDSYRSHGTAIEQRGWKVLDVGASTPEGRVGSASRATASAASAPGASPRASSRRARAGAAGSAPEHGELPSGLAPGQEPRVLEAKAV